MRRLIVRLLIFLIIALTSSSLLAQPKDLLAHSQQLFLVLTPTWNSVQGTLQVYQRSQTRSAWHSVGPAIPIVLGSSGSAWGNDGVQNHWPGPVKKEGDSRSPLGFYPLTTAFGFNAKPLAGLKMNYLPLHAQTVCVDDQHSLYYNQIVDAAKTHNNDWHSAEKMREIPLYQWGALISYNTEPVKAGAGSCIFLHGWRQASKGTAGCVAMDPQILQEILLMVDPKQHPVLAILTRPVLPYLQTMLAKNRIQIG